MADKRAIEFIEGWGKRTGEIKDNGLRMLVTRTLEAIKSMNGTNIGDMEFQRGMIRTDRETSQRFDSKIASDPDLKFFYTISESIELTMATVIDRLKQSAQNPVNNTQNEQEQKSNQVNPISHRPIMIRRPVSIVRPAEIPAQATLNAQAQQTNKPADTQVNTVQNQQTPQANQPAANQADNTQDNQTQPARRKRSRVQQIRQEEGPPALDVHGEKENAPPPPRRTPMNPATQELTSDSRSGVGVINVKQEEPDIDSNNNSAQLDLVVGQTRRAVKNEIPDDDYPDNDTPSTSRPATRSSRTSLNQSGTMARTPSSRTAQPQAASTSRASSGVSSPLDPLAGGGPMRRDSGRLREVVNEKTLNCSLCKEREMALSTFIAHLADKHESTPYKAKIAFKCSCGFHGNNAPATRVHKYSCRKGVLSVIDRLN